MKSINLIPPKNANRLISTWLALTLMTALAVGALAAIYYYVDHIESQAEQFRSEARQVERRTAEFLEQAVPRVSMNLLNEFASNMEGREAARINWETYLLDAMKPLPQSALVHSIASNDSGSIFIRAAFKSYEESIAYIHQLEQLPQAQKVNVNAFAESVMEVSEAVPVTDSEGAVLYYEANMAQHPVFELDLRVWFAEGASGHE